MKINEISLSEIDRNFSILIPPGNSNAFLVRTRETFSLPVQSVGFHTLRQNFGGLRLSLRVSLLLIAPMQVLPVVCTCSTTS